MFTEELSTVDGTPTPAEPMATKHYRSGAVILAALTVGVCAMFIAELLPANTLALVGLGVLVPALIIGVPLGRAFVAANESSTQWRAHNPVGARVAASRSRDHSITAIGVSGALAVIGVIGWVIFVNGGAVQQTFFNVEFMFKGLGDIFKALLVNVQIAVGAQILAMVFGLLLAVGRLLPGKGFAPIRALCITYIDVFRGIPSVVLIYLVCFGLPLTEVPVLSEGSLVVYAIVALSITYSAYNAELYRAGLESINPDQNAAAVSLGLTPGDVMRFVMVPQMFRNIAAPMLSQYIGLQKDTALVIVVGIIDAFSQAKIYAANDFNLSAVTAVCFVFVLITIPQTRFVDYLLARTSVSRKGK